MLTRNKWLLENTKHIMRKHEKKRDVNIKKERLPGLNFLTWVRTRVKLSFHLPLLISFSVLLSAGGYAQTKDTIGFNYAPEIMQNVLKFLPFNNPNHSTDYTCIVYHKMTFSFDTKKAANERNESPEAELKHGTSDQNLMLIESVSEKRHLLPNKTYEKIISGRVTGFNDPVLSLLPSQIKPFTLYNSYIKILDKTYLNPVSAKGLKTYLFTLEDTLAEENDTLFHLSFIPQQNPEEPVFKGFIHVDTRSLAIKHISLTTYPSDTLTHEIQVNQSFSLIEGKQWFPSEMKSTIIIYSTVTGQPFSFPLIARAKSTVTAVKLNPQLSADDFPIITFEDTTKIEPQIHHKYCHQPLSASDSATYRYIDSLRRQRVPDKLASLQENLIKGYLPAGPFLIELKHLIGYTSFEGLKLGMGLWTGEDISRKISVGGFYKRAFGKQLNNYGTGINWTIKEKTETHLALNYKDDQSVTGHFSFLKGPKVSLTDLLSTLTASTMDKTKVLEASIQTRFSKYFRGRLLFETKDVNPVTSYPFYDLEDAIDLPYSSNKWGINLRWKHKEPFLKRGSNSHIDENKWPTLRMNFIRGKYNYPDLTKTSYNKIEGQIEQSFNLSTHSQTTLRISGGTINGNPPPDELYSYFGTYLPFSVEIPFMFATMAPNEFAADKFSTLFLRHNIPLRPDRPGNFNPHIILSTSAGWGNHGGNSGVSNIKSFEKGFYESGLYLYNLFSQMFIKYGLAVHYRYGPYQKDKIIDNFSFRVGIEIGI